MENFGLVSVTNILCKVMVRLIRIHISQYLAEHSVLSPAQYDFTKIRSYFANLLCFLGEVIRRLDESKLKYFDFSKLIYRNLVFEGR